MCFILLICFSDERWALGPTVCFFFFTLFRFVIKICKTHGSKDGEGARGETKFVLKAFNLMKVIANQNTPQY